MNKISSSLWRQQVVYWEDDTKPDTMGKVRISGNFTQVNVSGLRPSSAYYLSVSAFNTAGPGPQSLPINASTKEPRKSTGSTRTLPPSTQFAPCGYMLLLSEVLMQPGGVLIETERDLDECKEARWEGPRWNSGLAC